MKTECSEPPLLATNCSMSGHKQSIAISGISLYLYVYTIHKKCVRSNIVNEINSFSSYDICYLRYIKEIPLL